MGAGVCFMYLISFLRWSGSSRVDYQLGISLPSFSGDLVYLGFVVPVHAEGLQF